MLLRSDDRKLKCVRDQAGRVAVTELFFGVGMNHFEILGLKKAALVLKAVADTMKSPTTKRETLVLVECVIKAANELEAKELTQQSI